MGYQGIGFTCGGFVHQTAMNRMHYYPNWVDKMNLRFVYRMYKEKHTRTRYLQAAFLFSGTLYRGKNFSDERADFAYCHVNNGEWQQQDEDSSRNNFSEYF
mgnify:CR=1 FL=1